MEGTVETYRRWAKHYDQDMVVFGSVINCVTAEDMCRLYPDEKSRDISILDCGAGTGLVGMQLSRVGFTTIDGFDCSEEMLEEARKKNVYRRLFRDVLGPNRLPVDDNSYDCVTAVGVFVAGDHAKADGLPEMIRACKPGGKIYISTRAANVLAEVSKHDLSETLEAAFQQHCDEGHWKWLSRRIVPKPHYKKDWDGYISIFEKL